MADPQIVVTLTGKRNEIEARIAAYEAEIKRCQYDLASINATLALFKQEGELRPHMGLARLFRRNELFRLCLEALAVANAPQDTRQLARLVAMAKGLDPEDRVLKKALALSIVTVLARQERKGVVQDAGRSLGVRVWKIN